MCPVITVSIGFRNGYADVHVSGWIHRSTCRMLCVHGFQPRGNRRLKNRDKKAFRHAPYGRALTWTRRKIPVQHTLVTRERDFSPVYNLHRATLGHDLGTRDSLHLTGEWRGGELIH